MDCLAERPVVYKHFGRRWWGALRCVRQNLSIAVNFFLKVNKPGLRSSQANMPAFARSVPRTFSRQTDPLIFAHFNFQKFPVLRATSSPIIESAGKRPAQFGRHAFSDTLSDTPIARGPIFVAQKPPLRPPP